MAFLALIGAGAPSQSETLRSVAQTYYDRVGQIAPLTGRDTTMDYYQRLLDDADSLNSPAPIPYTPELWQHAVQATAQLDLSVATQLLQRTFAPMGSIRGLGETFVRSSKDGTMQPVAVFVPSTYSPNKPAPLVVFLHGRLQPETRLLAQQFITDMAEQDGTIIVAPYGRGYYDYQGAESDIYDTLAAAQQAFNIDPHRQFLAGYSMGGFSVFMIAPMHPEDWSGVMSIAGSLLGSRADAVTTKLSRTKFYIVTGARDENVPTQYPTQTAVYLRNVGLPVTYYSQPDGTHYLISLRGILAQAWGDMTRGVVGLPINLSGDGELPEAVP
ncbi:MAG: alpha/beta hydrolase-fold protein [Candidatus Cybelea sp.]